MQNVLACARLFRQLFQKTLNLIAQHCLSVGRVHAVTVQFNKYPIGLSFYCDLCALPQMKTGKRRRIRARQRAALYLRNGQKAFGSLREIQTERALNHQWKNVRLTSYPQVSPATMRGAHVKRERAFI